MSKHIYQVHTRVFKQGDECIELSNFFSSLKKAEAELDMLRRIYNQPSIDIHEEPAMLEGQVSPTVFFNMRALDSDTRFRAVRILKVEVL